MNGEYKQAIILKSNQHFILENIQGYNTQKDKKLPNTNKFREFITIELMTFGQ